MNIALIGLDGTGKTTVCRLLSVRLDKKFISTDEEVEKELKTGTKRFIDKHGVEKLRDVESAVLERLSSLDECIFDTGYGIVMRNENIINLKKSSFIILLTADIKSLQNRLSRKSSKSRHINELKRIWQQYGVKYRAESDFTIDTSNLSPNEVCDLITHYLQMEIS